MAGSFEVLLSSLLSTESTIRVQAEEQYNGLALQLKLSHLISALRSGGSAADVKILAAVLLRRLFLQSADELVRVDVSILQACRSELLLAIQTEESPPVRRKICDAVAELARASIDDTDTNHWPDILKFLFECCSLDRPILYESALHIIRIVPAVFASQLEQYFEMIRQLLLQALNGPSHDVGEQAFRAACALLVSLEFPSLRQRLVDLLPSMLTVLWRSIEAQDDDAAFKAFIDLGEHRPKLLRSQLEKILDMMLKVMQIEDADNWKQLALEMVVTLAENAAPMIRKHDKFLPQIVETSLKFMLEIEDDEEWSTTDDVGEDEDSGSTAIAGETALDRLANALGGKAILPHIIRTIPQMLMSSDWQYRHAALMAISAIGEGCEKQMISVLEQVIVSVLPFCRDTHHRVKYAACNALGQMSSDFAPRLQEQHHSQIVPALLVALEESTNLRVKTHAGAALVNFCEPCPTEILVQYLPAIMPKLEGLLQLGLKELVENGRRLVIEQAITTLGTVADSVDEQFVPYYDHFMPSLKYVMANATSKELRLLRGKTIECVSIIGLAVGREKFMPDAQDILQMLFKFQNEQETLDSDDPQVSYMISAWARMCKIIGPESFLQYLPFVIKPLIQAASVKPEIAIVDSIEAEQNFSESEGWEFVTLADQQQFGIKTAGMDDKCTAMQMLVVYAKDLQDGFADYAEEVAKMMVPHLRFYFNELVRASAAQILPFLLECVKSKGPEVIQQMWMYISEKLLECIPLEPDTEITGIMIDSLCKCVELLGGTNCFTPEQYAKIVEIINDKLTGCLMREKERQDQRIDEDYDEQVEEELEEEDENDDFIMRKITDLVHSLFQTHGLTLIPLFDQIVPTLNKMLGVGQPSGQRAYAMCMYDDLLEFAGQSAVNYQQFFLNPLLDGIVDNSPVVRQAAGFGVGVMAQYCSKDFATTCLNSLSLLVSAIQRPDAREDFDSVNATENAIAAVAKICKHISNGVPYDSILPLWLSWLPVVEDRVEAVHVYSYLCDLIEGNNSLILGQNNSKVPKILSIIGEAVSRNVLERDNQVLQRLLAIVRHVQASGEVWQACIRLLSEKQQTALTTALAK